MSKIAKSSKSNEKAEKALTPVVVYFSAAGMAILGYTIARIALDGYPHPLHWLSLLGGGVIGYFVGWLWYRWRGDII